MNAPIVRSSDRLLDRILAVPDLAHAVPRLQPEVLHRVIQRYGLEDCGQLMALATPDQLAQVFDLDLWRPPAAGRDERFDADRFGAWLEVMVETAASGAATMLAAMDATLVAAGLAQHVRVFDHASVGSFVTLEGELASGFAFDDTFRCDVGGYVVSAKCREFWEAITAVLHALAETDSQSFNLIMRQCCRQSSSRPEVDGLDALLFRDEQAMFDVALDREARRDAQGYVTPAQARAFLQTSRRIDRRRGGLPLRDPLTRAYFRDVEARAERAPELSRVRPPNQETAPEPAAEAVAAIVDLLHEAGVMPQAPKALLEAAQTSARRFARIQTHLQFVHDGDPDVFATRSAELAYLANVITAGSTLQARPIAEKEASDAAMATCNLGLENWPAHWLTTDVHRRLTATGTGMDLPEDFLIGHDLVSVFQVGATVLHEDVCIYTADTLARVLKSLRYADREVQFGLDALRVTLMKHVRAGSPWDARDALDVIAILDTPAWAALLGLIDQFPTLHAAVGASLAGTAHQIDASAFEFISENRQIQLVHDFMQLLPAMLGS